MTINNSINQKNPSKTKKLLAALTLCACAFFALSIFGCGASNSSSGSANTSSSDKTITVAASPSPHAEILNNAVASELESQGYKLVVREFTDYVQPNTATEEGEVDANYFQHTPYLENFNSEKGTHLVGIANVHFEPFGLYPGKTKSIDALKDGATIAVPNDATNEARALLLLQDAGLIKLSNTSVDATVNDIVENPKNLKFRELEAATIPNVVSDVDLACINGNYAIPAGFSTSDALASETSTSLAAKTYANILAVKEGNENSDKIKALSSALTSDSVREYINDTYKGAVVPVF